MLSYHNDPKIKEKYVTRVRAHREADEIVKGKYWDDGKGCAVGCTIHGYEHIRYEEELGIPVALAYLQDSLFEALPNGEAKDFPLRFLESIPVGVDLTPVVHQFLHWLLVDPEDGVIRFAAGDERVEKAIEAVAALHYRAKTGQVIESSERDAAGAAACAAVGTAEAAAIKKQSEKLLQFLSEAGGSHETLL